MTNRELGLELARLAFEERKITNEILKLINLALERRAYLEHGFSSMFDWLTRGFGYSHSAAFRRIEAARLVRSVPAAMEKLEQGQVNLTTLSKAQTAIRTHEKATGEKINRAEILEKIENKSAKEAEHVLCTLLPESKLDVKHERRIVIDEETTRHSMNFSKEMSEDLKRAKELLSHKFPNASDADIVGYALKLLVEKTTSAAASKRVRILHKGCSYKDPVSGRVCGSRYQVQIDHILPKALGGTNEAENLRPLCRKHNLMMAEKFFGKTHMERFRSHKE